MKYLSPQKLQYKVIFLMAIVPFLIGCNATDAEKNNTTITEKPDYVSFAEDVAFMKEYVDIIQLSDATGKAKVAVSAALQGRVMTSSSSTLKAEVTVGLIEDFLNQKIRWNTLMFLAEKNDFG